ncbi:hypothetical protein QFZ69_001200 [Arthrobacter sp. V1I7]|nr:hypothetical protein [Arthrobacter sp. V1I7]
MVVPGGLDADFHRNIRPGQRSSDQGEDPVQAPPCHLKFQRTQQTVPARISDRQRDHLLAHIDGNNHG